MKKLVNIIIILFIVTLFAKPTQLFDGNSINYFIDKSQNPIKAIKKNNFNPFEIDTLFATIDGIDFIITPKGNVIWKDKNENKVNLKTNSNIDNAYIYKTHDYLYIFYTETDFDVATSRVKKFNIINPLCI